MLEFDFSFVKGVGWYPGHMLKATRDIKKKLKLVDLVLILTDARVPQSALNPKLFKVTESKPTLLVLNKADLAEADKIKAWGKALKTENGDFVVTETINRRGLKQIMDMARSLITAERKRRGATRPLLRPVRLMVIGVPNVGKSSLINALNRKKSAKTGPRPGVTRSQQWIKLADDMELLDTPGIMPPGNPMVECGLRLGLTNAVKQDLIGKSLLVHYLFSQLFLHEKFDYLKKLGVQFPVTNTDHALKAIARKLGFLLPGDTEDIRKTEEYILRAYTDGKFGRLSLDTPEGFPVPEEVAKDRVRVLWPQTQIDIDDEDE